MRGLSSTLSKDIHVTIIWDMIDTEIQNKYAKWGSLTFMHSFIQVNRSWSFIGNFLVGPATSCHIFGMTCQKMTLNCQSNLAYFQQHLPQSCRPTQIIVSQQVCVPIDKVIIIFYFINRHGFRCFSVFYFANFKVFFTCFLSWVFLFSSIRWRFVVCVTDIFNQHSFDDFTLFFCLFKLPSLCNALCSTVFFPGETFSWGHGHTLWI